MRNRYDADGWASRPYQRRGGRAVARPYRRPPGFPDLKIEMEDLRAEAAQPTPGPSEEGSGAASGDAAYNEDPLGTRTLHQVLAKKLAEGGRALLEWRGWR